MAGLQVKTVPLIDSRIPCQTGNAWPFQVHPSQMQAGKAYFPGCGGKSCICPGGFELPSWCC